MDFEKLISLGRLFSFWDEFKKGKRSKPDVLEFEFDLENNIFNLQRDLESRTYRHGPYATFHICDPKSRKISKASVRDRLVHHLVFDELYSLFEKNFIFHSYSSRLGKGTHSAVKNLEKTLKKVSRNYHQSVYALKLDIRKFFSSIPHQKLMEIMKRKIKDQKFLWLLEEIIGSFPKKELGGGVELKGLAIGNVTSQILANIYLNELDQYVKHGLKIKNYFRYTDDIVLVSQDKEYLKENLKLIESFLNQELDLKLHPGKIIIRKLSQGVDFLGYVVLPYYKVLRTKTKKRMFRKLALKRKLLKDGKITEKKYCQTIQSYLGVLGHCRGHKLEEKIIKMAKFE